MTQSLVELMKTGLGLPVPLSTDALARGVQNITDIDDTIMLTERQRKTNFAFKVISGSRVLVFFSAFSSNHPIITINNLRCQELRSGQLFSTGQKRYNSVRSCCVLGKLCKLQKGTAVRLKEKSPTCGRSVTLLLFYWYGTTRHIALQNRCVCINENCDRVAGSRLSGTQEDLN